MKLSAVILSVLLLLVFNRPTCADIVTIDFEGFSIGSFSSGSEDGFDLLVTQTGPAQIFNNDSFLPISGNFLASNTNVNSDTILSMSETDGTTFMFRSLDGKWSANQISQTITVEGFLGGASVGTDLFDVAANSAATFMAANLDGVMVDELRFTLTGRSTNPGPRQETWLDNIVVSNVPEPNSAALLALIGSGMACKRRRRKVTPVLEGQR